MRRRTSRLEHKENMAHQLLILGLLAEGPKHGYQIKKLMREISGRFTTIDTSSIYYPLTQLEKEGFLEKRVGRSGKRPEKFIYQLTKAGREKFVSLLKENLISMQRPFFNIDLCLYFLPFLQKEEAKIYLKKREERLARIIRWLCQTVAAEKEKKIPLHLLSILKHQLNLVKAEQDYINNLRQELKHA